ncbi:kinase-like domain-containing protein [Baffinella frigidus]|nr:kinase-like domain-containing protein [Cryptophyta sp. CCMP2293]
MLETFYGESWVEKRRRIKGRSQSGGQTGWDLVVFIIKSNDDIRQEQFAMTLITQFHEMFKAARCNCWLRPYSVVATAPDSGFIEVVPDTASLHSLRDEWVELRWPAPEQTLYTHFVQCYGPEHTREYKTAQRNFIESMAGYAVLCYLLQVKDRNDGNLLLTRDGHIVHIDFGFMLSNTPGDMAFEQAPFKLTSEYVQVMGGKDSGSFAYFRELCVQGFLEARKPQNRDKILLLVEMMSAGIGDELGLPCVSGQNTAELVATLKGLYMVGKSEGEVRSWFQAYSLELRA